MDTSDRIAVELQAGTRLVLQRVGRTTTAEDVVRRLGAAGLDAVEVDTLRTDDDRRSVRVLDGRSGEATRFDGWDGQREGLAEPERPAVVLLDVASSALLLQHAPHTASWAGGVRLPLEPLVRTVRTDAELEQAEAAAARRLAADPALRTELAGQTTVFDLLTERFFVGRADAGPLAVAREALDEGLVHYVRVDGSP